VVVWLWFLREPPPHPDQIAENKIAKKKKIGRQDFFIAKRSPNFFLTRGARDTGMPVAPGSHQVGCWDWPILWKHQLTLKLFRVKNGLPRK
jgi:hypothetical protein